MKTQFETTTDLQSLPLPPGIPILGNLLQLEATRLHLILEDWARKYGDFYRLKVAARTALVVSDWQAVSEILRARPETFRRFSSIETVFGDMGISGVLSFSPNDKYIVYSTNMSEIRVRNLQSGDEKIYVTPEYYQYFGDFVWSLDSSKRVIFVATPKGF